MLCMVRSTGVGMDVSKNTPAAAAVKDLIRRLFLA